MVGFATKLFLKNEENSELNDADEGVWPLFHLLVKKEYFSLLEKAFARNAQSEEEALLLAFVLLAARRGHLAIKIESGVISPSPSSFMGFTEEKRLLEEELSQLNAALCVAKTERLHTLENYFYLPRHFSFETQFLNLVRKTISMPIEDQILSPEWRNILEEYVSRGLLLPLQSLAIEKCLTQRLTIITGGPGTGKTYTASHLIHLIWKLLPEDSKKAYEIVITAPTGKAAAHVHASLLKLLKDEELLSHLSSKTLHSLLGLKMDAHELFDAPLEPISADLVIVDESSMVDASLMVQLFASLKQGARLVLIGDKFQLPPVDAGSMFSDLCEMIRDHVVELKDCMRSDLKTIVSIAKHINEGSSREVLEYLPLLRPSGIDFNHEDPKEIQKKALLLMLEKFPYTQGVDLQELERSFNEFRVLSTLRKGFLGVDELNNQCMLQLKQKAYLEKKPFVAPIMLVANDHVKQLYNGEVGLLFFTEDGLVDSAYFHGKVVSLKDLPAYEYAYCLSVHKSQGSEFDHLLLVLPDRSELFGREVLYTAVTRAKKSLQIYASDKVLTACMEKPSRRVSSLQHRWSLKP